MGSGDSGCCSMAEVNSLILLLILFIILLIILLSIVLLIFIVIITLSRRSVQETQWEGKKGGSWRSGSRTSLTGLYVHIFIFIFIFNPWMIVIIHTVQ